jgi:hypothetical protein
MPTIAGPDRYTQGRLRDAKLNHTNPPLTEEQRKRQLRAARSAHWALDQQRHNDPKKVTLPTLKFMGDTDGRGWKP